MNIFPFIPGYEQYIYSSGREPAFFMLAAFIVTYLITRGYTRMAKRTGWGSAHVGGVHAHHLVFGLIIAFTAGSLMFALLPEQGPLLILLAIAFGCGVSLVLDEFALIFHLKDVYWEEEGRKSIDAVVLGAAFSAIFLMHRAPFGISSEEGGVLLFATILINTVIVLIAALKGKIFLALFGIFIPTVSLIGAIRLAEPDSIWARKFYKNKPRKLKRSRDRYAKYDRIWRKRKEYIWDLIGGKVGRTVTDK